MDVPSGRDRPADGEADLGRLGRDRWLSAADRWGIGYGPHFAFYTPEGKWEVENHGVAPDVEIEFDPKAWREGHDPQLEKAVAWLLAELEKNPQQPRRPPYPNYHKPRNW